MNFDYGSAAKMPRNNIKVTAELPSSFVLLSQTYCEMPVFSDLT